MPSSESASEYFHQLQREVSEAEQRRGETYRAENEANPERFATVTLEELQESNVARAKADVAGTLLAHLAGGAEITYHTPQTETACERIVGEKATTRIEVEGGVAPPWAEHLCEPLEQVVRELETRFRSDQT